MKHEENKKSFESLLKKALQEMAIQNTGSCPQIADVLGIRLKDLPWELQLHITQCRDCFKIYTKSMNIDTVPASVSPALANSLRWKLAIEWLIGKIRKKMEENYPAISKIMEDPSLAKASFRISPRCSVRATEHETHESSFNHSSLLYRLDVKNAQLTAIAQANILCWATQDRSSYKIDVSEFDLPASDQLACLILPKYDQLFNITHYRDLNHIVAALQRKMREESGSELAPASDIIGQIIDISYCFQGSIIHASESHSTHVCFWLPSKFYRELNSDSIGLIWSCDPTLLSTSTTIPPSTSTADTIAPKDCSHD